MEMRDGFIISVFNYCDRWCDTCSLSSYCRVFVAMTGDEASSEINMAALVGAAPHDGPPAPPKWLEDVFEELNSLAGRPFTHEELLAGEPTMAAAHQEIYERAKAYCVWVHDVGHRQYDRHRDPTDPRAVISWFSSLTASTIRRALTGLADFDGNREVPPDHEGAAKVALLGIDRSYAAWQQLVTDHGLSAVRARPCLEALAWLRTRLEAAIPDARAFVRPGFDEPEAVARLRAAAASRPPERAL